MTGMHLLNKRDGCPARATPRCPEVEQGVLPRLHERRELHGLAVDRAQGDIRISHALRGLTGLCHLLHKSSIPHSIPVVTVMGRHLVKLSGSIIEMPVETFSLQVQTVRFRGMCPGIIVTLLLPYSHQRVSGERQPLSHSFIGMFGASKLLSAIAVAPRLHTGFLCGFQGRPHGIVPRLILLLGITASDRITTLAQDGGVAQLVTQWNTVVSGGRDGIVVIVEIKLYHTVVHELLLWQWPHTVVNLQGAENRCCDAAGEDELTVRHLAISDAVVTVDRLEAHLRAFRHAGDGGMNGESVAAESSKGKYKER